MSLLIAIDDVGEGLSVKYASSSRPPGAEAWSLGVHIKEESQ
jgi:hypothetical protein